MRTLRALVDNRRGAAAAEMALVMPLLLALMFGSVELGNYFYNEHKLVTSVRDGARFAARQRLTNFSACTGSPPQTVIDDTKLIVRKGTLDSTAVDLLPNWATATFSLTMSCTATLDGGAAGTFAPAGIYANITTGAPTVLLSASLSYRPLLATTFFGFTGTGLSLNATQTAAVSGL